MDRMPDSIVGGTLRNLATRIGPVLSLVPVLYGPYFRVSLQTLIPIDAS